MGYLCATEKSGREGWAAIYVGAMGTAIIAFEPRFGAAFWRLRRRRGENSIFQERGWTGTDID
jgi:hypothetical protein